MNKYEQSVKIVNEGQNFWIILPGFLVKNGFLKKFFRDFLRFFEFSERFLQILADFTAFF